MGSSKASAAHCPVGAEKKKTTKQKLNSMVEQAVIGSIRGRNKYLIWVMLSPWMAADFALKMAALNMAQWRAGKQVSAGKGLPPLAGPRLQEVTDQLGFQVRKAVEVLVQAIDRIDQDRNRDLLAGLPKTALYQAALTVMMRLVFLFSAEERDLLLLGEPEFLTSPD